MATKKKNRIGYCYCQHVIDTLFTARHINSGTDGKAKQHLSSMICSFSSYLTACSLELQTRTLCFHLKSSFDLTFALHCSDLYSRPHRKKKMCWLNRLFYLSFISLCFNLLSVYWRIVWRKVKFKLVVDFVRLVVVFFRASFFWSGSYVQRVLLVSFVSFENPTKFKISFTVT